MSKQFLLQLSNVGLTDPLSKSQLLKEISFNLITGERLVLIGPSGSGKTTLLRLINRLQEPSTGKILFCSQPLEKIPIIDLRQQIVLVPQEPKLLGMSVNEALSYALKLQNISKAEINQRLQKWKSRLSIPNQWLERYESELSLGQRQIIGITRGLIIEPKILLLDEPTSSLDSLKANQIIKLLTNITQYTQTAIVIVSHDLEVVKSFSKYILKLEQGKIK
ncbi:ABC transporter ATP-binding protein [Candidatus Atelocyanobacterium thalassae]|uniref:ABC-type metal ion transport system, ATPase component n=1 Tax=Atelocyanobacterium thalassa (isolate ALOHA) TaxID=1453429 RepID=D3EQ55_ATETH|nr:ATP-binding cassette domain-containing protein [Candidatus Atelocyanobacterium thalassa]ADB95605.1 ABC-type metal ion transport system, ATPase component [Candidatus Atelocyanobacterium thalassa isolate ALOHA]|tara:strand:+ start:29901 stop:30563 length:663 start_codon:yes stop_codon:yes gene_type:complete